MISENLETASLHVDEHRRFKELNDEQGSRGERESSAFEAKESVLPIGFSYVPALKQSLPSRPGREMTILRGGCDAVVTASSLREE